MELREQPVNPTLARKLGDVPHVSRLLKRISQTTGAGDRVVDWLLKVAVQRGADHYRREFDSSLPPDSPAISSEEIGVALCLGQLPYALDHVRAAAQLLSSPHVDAAHLCRLAVQERCEPVLLHIAQLAERFAPDLEPWASVRRNLPPRPVPRTDALPHWSRLVSHTGSRLTAARLTPSGSAAMNNPLRILETLDRHLTTPAEMTLFGRAALALGYSGSPAGFAATHDVDAILSLSWLAAEDDNLDFWQAQQRTNAELEPEGLYLTHLFRELEVILTPDWLKWRVRISRQFQRLTLFRPSTLDLILTKYNPFRVEDVLFALPGVAPSSQRRAEG